MLNPFFTYVSLKNMSGLESLGSVLDEIAEMSYYEDALDESDHELKSLVEATEIQLSKMETRLKR